MTYKKLTAAEEKRLAEAFTAHALAMGLKSNQTLPKAMKEQVRARVLREIEDLREAKQAKDARQQEYEAAETTYHWQPPRRR